MQLITELALQIKFKLWLLCNLFSSELSSFSTLVVGLIKRGVSTWVLLVGVELLWASAIGHERMYGHFLWRCLSEYWLASVTWSVLTPVFKKYDIKWPKCCLLSFKSINRSTYLTDRSSRWLLFLYRVTFFDKNNHSTFHNIFSILFSVIIFIFQTNIVNVLILSHIQELSSV